MPKWTTAVGTAAHMAQLLHLTPFVCPSGHNPEEVRPRASIGWMDAGQTETASKKNQTVPSCVEPGPSNAHYSLISTLGLNQVDTFVFNIYARQL